MPTYYCPTCKKVTRVELREDAIDRPFCSERCKLIDLHHWFAGDYVISDPLTSDPESLDLPTDDPSTEA